MALSSSNSFAILTASHFSNNSSSPSLTATATSSSVFSSSSSSSRPTSNYNNKKLNSFNLSNPNYSNSHKWRTKVSFFPSFLKKGKDTNLLKEDLLDAIAPLDRGADASPQDQLTVDQLARKLEGVNPTKQPLKSDLINGKWELLYTTSLSILQTSRPKLLRSRTNYQAINVDKLRAQNMESAPFFNQVTADLTPLNSKKVAVKFDYFKIAGLIPVKAPDTAVGELEITYLDDELRISRGDKGNLFILKMIDPSYRIPA